MDDKGAVESSVRFVSGRWWRTMGAATPEEAQRSLDVFCATTGDERERRGPNGERRHRRRAGRRRTAARPPGRAIPRPPPRVPRVVADNASVAFCGNRYSVPPGLSGTALHSSGTGSRLATIDVGGSFGGDPRHPLAWRRRGSGALVRRREHRQALEAAVLSAFTTARPWNKKANRPPGREALEEAARLLGPIGREPVVDLFGLWRDRGGAR